MDSRKFASVFGSACLAVGLLSLWPSLVGADLGLPALQLPVSYGNFLGLFAMNVMNKAALIAVGAFGLAAANAEGDAHHRSVRYARAVCGLTLAMALLGLIPQTNTLFGYWPLFGTGNVAMALVFAAVSGVYGFYAPASVRNYGTSAL